MKKIFFVILVISFAVIQLNNKSFDSKGERVFASKDINEIFEISTPHDFANEIGYFFVLKEMNQGYETLTTEQKYIAAIWELESEVNNGGFNQFYFNSAGDHALLTEKALTEIGSSSILNMLQKANSYFPGNSPSPDRNIRWKQMEQWDKTIEEKLNKLDEDFYKYEEDIHSLLYQYCQKNLAKIKK